VTEAPRVQPIDLWVDIDVEPAVAWAAVTDPGRIAEWFTDASALGPVGSPYRLDFGEGSIVGGTVLRIDPGRSFAYSWHWSGADDAETTTVTWSVEALPDGGSRIRVVHTGWDEAGMDASARDDHEGYWSGYLEDLRAVLDEA
jgi:uncharacterized protein YndB with AHSA1/START domain